MGSTVLETTGVYKAMRCHTMPCTLHLNQQHFPSLKILVHCNDTQQEKQNYKVLVNFKYSIQSPEPDSICQNIQESYATKCQISTTQLFTQKHALYPYTFMRRALWLKNIFQPLNIPFKNLHTFAYVYCTSGSWVDTSPDTIPSHRWKCYVYMTDTNISI